ncbi:MAG: M20/M25/M40 family metallo-hydrolase, partial [Rhodobacteraceae bacterium]|nr:M20/M25/M40 family metallo-hydrolase [Paracoccaceae bacterium]
MNIKERLFAEIDDRQDDLIALTRELVAMPTLNPPGDNYLEICEYLKARFERSGMQTELIRAEGSLGDSDKYPRWNIIGRKEGTHSGDCIHFNSHTDVVHVGENWTKEPFGGEIEDGKIYGRGTCDMKGGMATSIVAVESFLAICPEFPGAVEISGTADEESGGYSGVAWLAERGWFSP